MDALLITLDSLLGPVRQLGGVGCDTLQLASCPGGLVLCGDAVERNVVQLLDLGNVLLNLGNVLLDGGHLEQPRIKSSEPDRCICKLERGTIQNGAKCNICSS